LNSHPDGGRLRRLKFWVVVLTLGAALFFLILGKPPYTKGVMAGGFLIILNLLGTEKVVGSFFTGGVLARAVYGLIYLTKLALTAGIIAGFMHWKIGSYLGLVIGLLVLPAGLIADFLIFPGNKKKNGSTDGS